MEQRPRHLKLVPSCFQVICRRANRLVVPLRSFCLLQTVSTRGWVWCSPTFVIVTSQSATPRSAPCAKRLQTQLTSFFHDHVRFTIAPLDGLGTRQSLGNLSIAVYILKGWDYSICCPWLSCYFVHVVCILFGIPFIRYNKFSCKKITEARL